MNDEHDFAQHHQGHLGTGHRLRSTQYIQALVERGSLVRDVHVQGRIVAAASVQ